MNVYLCNEDGGDIILETDWNAVPSAGDKLYISHAKNPGYERTKYTVVNVLWSITAITGDKGVRDIGTHVEVYLKRM